MIMSGHRNACLDSGTHGQASSRSGPRWPVCHREAGGPDAGSVFLNERLRLAGRWWTGRFQEHLEDVGSLSPPSGQEPGGSPALFRGPCQGGWGAVLPVAQGPESTWRVAALHAPPRSTLAEGPSLGFVCSIECSHSSAAPVGDRDTHRCQRPRRNAACTVSVSSRGWQGNRRALARSLRRDGINLHGVTGGQWSHSFSIRMARV